MNKGQTTGRLLLSALLAFNLFGFVGIGYADPAAPSEGFVDDAVEVVDPEVPAASEVPEGSDLAEPEAPVDAQESDALAEADPVDEPESDAINAKEPEDSAEAQAAAPGVRVASAEEAAPTETTSYAQPGSGDFDFDSRTGTINKLKASYVAGLTDEQKQDVRLVIPAEINGVAVTALGDSAFYSYTNRGLTFTEFDLSQTTSLQAIGSNVIRYGYNLSGDLVIPDTVTTIGASAFADCGYTGALHLPQNDAFTTIPDQAFLDTKFSGTLDIPSSVKTIGRKSFEGTCFSGALVIPEGVETMYASAFASCAYLTSVSIPSTMDFAVSGSDSGHHFQECSSLEEVVFAENSSMTTLYSQDFAYCPKLKVLSLPDSIVNIDAKAFYSCGLQTVYLPASAKITANASSFLYNCSGAVAVCKDKVSYDSYKAQFASAQQKFLGYPLSVSFEAGSSGVAPDAIERLFNQQLNRVKDEATQAWVIDSTYTLPLAGSVEAGWKTPWFSDAAHKTAMKETSLVSSDPLVLYPGATVLEEPTFSYHSIHKTYDGETSYLKVDASHPLAKDHAEAEVGDYAFYYAWVYWPNGASGKIVKQGFDDSMGFSEVSESTLGSTFYSVQSYLYQLTESGWKKVLGSYTEYYLRVQIEPATPSVNPLITTGEGNLEGFPRLSVSEGDAPGTITWDAGQALEEGTHTYTWTFTPEGDVPNYTSATGTMDLRVTDGSVIQQVSFDTGGGSVLEPVDVPVATSLPSGTVPTREGFVFVGWYRDAALTQLWHSTDPVTEDMTLYAKWETRGASIDPGEGVINTDKGVIDRNVQAVDILCGSEVTQEEQDALKRVELPAGTYEPARFVDLALMVDGAEVGGVLIDRVVPITISHVVSEGSVYRIVHLENNGEVVEVLEGIPDFEAQTITFYGDTMGAFMIAEQHLYQVNFDSNGGSAVAGISDVPAGTCVDAPAIPTKDGYLFVGWYGDEAYTQPWVASNPVLENMTLHARWEKRVVAVDPGKDDVIVNGEPIDQESHAVDVLHKPEVAPEEQEALEQVELPAGSEPTAFFELTLVIDGTELDKAEFGEELAVSVPYPVKAGVLYRVIHMKHDGTTEFLDAQADVADQTLTFSVGSLSPFMVVEQRLYEVTFDSAGGASVASLTNIPNGTKITAPKTPTRSGYAFVGWYKDAEGSTAWDFANDTVTGDTTLYARWKADEKEDPGRDPGTSDDPTTSPGGSDNQTTLPNETDDPTTPPKDTSGDPKHSPADNSQAVGDSGTGSAVKQLPASSAHVATGDGVVAVPLLLGVAAGAVVLALAAHRARRRMR